ncbi:MAG: hypothetical protein ACKO7B_20175, partial [Flavobacteriales bacterium]
CTVMKEPCICGAFAYILVSFFNSYTEREGREAKGEVQGAWCEVLWMARPFSEAMGEGRRARCEVLLMALPFSEARRASL